MKLHSFKYIVDYWRVPKNFLGHDSNESDTTLHNIGAVGDNHGFQKVYMNEVGKQIQRYLKEDTK